MLHLLEREQHHLVSPITHPLAHYLSVQSVIAGTGPGLVWVDEPLCPRSAFVRAPEGFHLLGDPGNEAFAREVARFDCEEVVPDGRRLGGRYSCLHYWPREWQGAGRPVLSALSPSWGYQRFLLLDSLRVDWRALLPDGYELVRVDAELLNGSVQGAGAIDGWGFWSLEDFLQSGFSFCILQGRRIVSRCTSDCVVGNRAEVGSYTDPAHRGKGLATAAVAAAAEHCLQSGIAHIGWHCWSPNEASLRTARRVGLTHVLDH